MQNSLVFVHIVLGAIDLYLQGQIKTYWLKYLADVELTIITQSVTWIGPSLLDAFTIMWTYYI